MTRRLTLLLMLALAPWVLNAQITQIRPVDIGAALRAGTAHVTCIRSAGGDSLKPFDGHTPASETYV